MDVVVLGAGPAGSAAARLLALWGHDVLLVSRGPSRPPLAESLPPSTTKLLDRIGVREAVDSAGFLRSTGNTVLWGGSGERVELFGDGALGYQVPRDRLDAILLGEAVAAGATVLEGSAGRVLHPEETDSTPTVSCSTSEGTQSLSAPWILDCRGRSGSFGRRKSDAETKGSTRGASARTSSPHERRAPRTLALVGVWHSESWPVGDGSHTLVESYGNGWAWSVPVTGKRRFVTVMIDPNITRLDGRLIDRQYREQLARTEWIGPLASRVGHMVGQPWACDATEHCSTEIAEDGLLRVGDAASFVDPLSSFGVKKALASAWLAAVVAHTCLEDPTLAGPAMELYQARERAMFRSLSRAAAALATPAGAGQRSAFWDARVRHETDDGEGFASDIDVSVLRSDPDVQRALSSLREREQLQVTAGADVTLVPLPAVSGNRITLQEHVVNAAFPAGVRWLRNVDLVLLASLAPEHDQVSDLYGAYLRAAAPVPMPDFLGALATLVGKEVLTLT